MGVHRAEGAEGEVRGEQGSRRTRCWPHPTLNTPCPSNQPRYSKRPPAFSLLKLWGFTSLTRGWLAVKQPAPPDPHVAAAKYHRPRALERPIPESSGGSTSGTGLVGLLPLLASRAPLHPLTSASLITPASVGMPLTPRTQGGPHRERLARCRHCPGRRRQREELLSTGAAAGPSPGDCRPRLPWGRAGLRSVPGTKKTGCQRERPGCQQTCSQLRHDSCRCGPRQDTPRAGVPPAGATWEAAAVCRAPSPTQLGLCGQRPGCLPEPVMAYQMPRVRCQRPKPALGRG